MYLCAPSSQPSKQLAAWDRVLEQKAEDGDGDLMGAGTNLRPRYLQNGFWYSESKVLAQSLP